MRDLVVCRSGAACLLLTAATGVWCQSASSADGEKLNSQPATSRAMPHAGDLAALRATAAATLRIAEAGDLSAARRRVDDLERDWNRQAPELKSRAPDKWRSLDAAIDRAERELRFGRVRHTDSVAALRDVVSILNSMK